MITRLSILLLVSLLAAGCTHKGPASIAGGECKIFERPEYEVRGQKQYDQDWIDSQVEGGGGGCGWPPPKPRPPELDAAPPTRATPPPPAKKKPGLIRRIKGGAEAAFTRKRGAVPALSVPTEQFVPPPAPPPIAAAPPEPAAPPPAPPPPPRRSLVDQLLHPE